jgi:predicted nucleic acid-binding protein
VSTFIDTSAFLALANATDINHTRALTAWRELLSTNELLVTTSYSVVETVSLLHSRHGTQAVQRFLEDLLSAVLVEWIDVRQHSSAVSALLATPGKSGPSLVDCAAFEVIRASRIDCVFAYDQHF